MEEIGLEKKKKESQNLHARITTLEANSARLKSEIEEIIRKLALLAAESGAKCPLCEQELGVEERRRIDMKYNEEKQTKTGLLQSAQADLTAGRNTLLRMDREIARASLD